MKALDLAHVFLSFWLLIFYHMETCDGLDFCFDGSNEGG